MLALSRKSNHLQKIVEDNKWITKIIIWEKVEASSLPRLTIQNLQRITIGVYQLKQAASYTREHPNEDRDYILYTRKEDNGIIRVKIQSRQKFKAVFTLILI